MIEHLLRTCFKLLPFPVRYGFGLSKKSESLRKVSAASIGEPPAALVDSAYAQTPIDQRS